jgi:hypothetical protein
MYQLGISPVSVSESLDELLQPAIKAAHINKKTKITDLFMMPPDELILIVDLNILLRTKISYLELHIKLYDFNQRINPCQNKISDYCCFSLQIT